MSSTVFPRKVSRCQASQQSVMGSSCTSDTSLHPRNQFLNVVRRKTSGVFTDLRPHEFHWIQFRRTSWKTVFMHTRMIVDELLCGRRDMNFVVIPDKNNVAGYQFQHLLQENGGLLRTQGTLKGAYTQTNPSQFRTDEQSAQQIHTLMMVQTCPRSGRLSARRPASFEWRHQREARFVD